jgi:hypothetical protein
MKNVEASSQAWQKAVSILEAKEELSGGEKAQLAEYQTCLKASRDKVSAKLKDISPHEFQQHPADDPSFPWIIAEKCIHNEMQEGRYDTSVGVLISGVMQKSESMQMRVIYVSHNVRCLVISSSSSPLIIPI